MIIKYNHRYHCQDEACMGSCDDWENCCAYDQNEE